MASVGSGVTAVCSFTTLLPAPVFSAISLRAASARSDG